MASQTISVKYIPNTTIDSFNTMISAVPVLNCLFTLHVESFSCRVSRADKQHFENQRKEHQMNGTTSNSSTPHHTFSTPQHRCDDDADFGFDCDPAQQNTAFAPSEGGATATPPLSYVSPLSGQQHTVPSGRPCFPEYFVLPHSAGMGSQQGSGASPGVRLNNATQQVGADQTWNQFGGFSLDNDLPAPAVPPPTSGGLYFSGAFASKQSVFNVASTSGAVAAPVHVPTSPEEAYTHSLQIISERLVYLVGALNSLYGTSDYDFSVLEPSDFLLVNPISFINEVTNMLNQLPYEMHSYTGQHGEAFWRAIGAMVGRETSIYDASTNMSECDVFLFQCPQCDPASQTKQWSQHYFVYHKKNKVVISLLAFTEGSQYRNPTGDYGGVNKAANVEGGIVSGVAAGNSVDAHGKHQRIPMQTTHGEFYIDNDGNTHVLGSEDDDVHLGMHGDNSIMGGALGGHERPASCMDSTPTPTPHYGGDTPQYHHASTADTNGEWGGECY